MAYYEKIKALSYATKINPRDAVAYVTLGTMFQQKGNYSLAKDLYLKAMDIDDTLSEAHHHLGVIYLDEDRYTSALDELAKARKLSPDDARIRHRLGQAKAGHGEVRRGACASSMRLSLWTPSTRPPTWKRRACSTACGVMPKPRASAAPRSTTLPKMDVSGQAKLSRGSGLIDKITSHRLGEADAAHVARRSRL